MLMKNYLFSVLSIVILLCSCSKESAFINSNSQSVYSINSTASSTIITFDTNNSWTAKSSESWLTITPSSGNAGDNIKLTISALANSEYDSREAYVTLTAGEASQIISFTQMQKAGFVLSDSKLSIGSEGGVLNIPIKANIDYNCKVNDSCKDWLSVTQTKSLNNFQISLTVSKNETYDDRTGLIEISYADQKEMITIYQSQLDEMIVDTKEFSIGSDGGEIMIPITTNIEYQADVLGSASEWISIKTVQTRSVEDYYLVVNASENESYEMRMGQIKVTGAGKESIITINQSQRDELNIPVINYEIGSQGGSISIKVQSNTEYNCEIIGNAKEWISINSPSRSLSESEISLSISPNTTYNNRIGQVKIYGANKESVITINQYQLDEVTINTNKYSIDSNGGDLTIQIGANVEYVAEVDGQSSEWLTIKTSKTRSLEYYNLIVSVAENKLYDNREGYIKITGAGKEKTITITQKGIPSSGSINGHEWVDLGLPSGTLWATRNIGSSQPEESGTDFTWGNYFAAYNSVEDPTITMWGSPWETPKAMDFYELIDPSFTSYEFVVQNNYFGLRVISKKNKNTIFFPAKVRTTYDGEVLEIGEYLENNPDWEDGAAFWFGKYNGEYIVSWSIMCSFWGSYPIRPIIRK